MAKLDSSDAGHGNDPPRGRGGPPGGPGGFRGPPGGRGGPPPDPIEIFETQDANKDGKLVGEEIPAHMQQRMDFVDTDGDGEVSRKEIEALAEHFKHHGPPGGGRGPGGPGGGGPGGPPPGGHDAGAPDAAGHSSEPARPQRPPSE